MPQLKKFSPPKNTETLRQITDALGELTGDSSVPRNVRNKLAHTLQILNGGEEQRIKVSKALEELDEIIDDPNMQPYTRTQIWNIVSLLETV